MSIFDRIRSWWSKDAVERADEEALSRATPAQRAAGDEEFEMRKEDLAAREHLGMEGVDFERDSEPPRSP